MLSWVSYSDCDSLMMIDLCFVLQPHEDIEKRGIFSKNKY